ncbi:tyrosine-type recombinase/integrase [Streptomyces sp. NPDC020125]|uniref:tyrosine-type recombinase/integrase n=1 Tax=Streptomyces sp. NPDC020125 TaxID=3154593 RepID=UPI0033C684A0
MPRDATHWDEVVTSLGLEHLRRHDLRHTGLTWMAGAGIPLHVLRVSVGHGSLMTTQRYLHLDLRTIAQAALSTLGADILMPATTADAERTGCPRCACAAPASPRRRRRRRREWPPGRRPPARRGRPAAGSPSGRCPADGPAPSAVCSRTPGAGRGWPPGRPAAPRATGT